MHVRSKKPLIPIHLRKKPGPKRKPPKPGQVHHENEKVPIKPVKIDSLTEGLE